MTNRIQFNPAAQTPQTIKLQGMVAGFLSSYNTLLDLVNEANQANYGTDTASVQAMFGCMTQTDASNLLYELTNVQTFLQTPSNAFLDMLGRMGN